MVDVPLNRSVLNHVLSKRDFTVATLRNPKVLSELSRKYSQSQFLILKLDVTNEDEIHSPFQAAQTEFSRIDVVYNNAGYQSCRTVARETFKVNFWRAANVSMEAVRCFRNVNRPTGGVLLQASSGGGMYGAAGLAYYCARSVQ